MIDLHCHILPGLDDGAHDWAEAMDMARSAQADGIEVVVATPHVYDQRLSLDRIRDTVASLRDRLVRENIKVDIIAGAEFYYDTRPDLAEDYVITGTRSLLVEFPHSHLPITVEQCLVELLGRGLHPIIVHPERNPGIMADPGRLLHLLGAGVYVQVTADSITGAWGGPSQDCAHYLLSRGVVDFIASDAHSSEHRPPRLSDAVRIAARLIGKKAARMLVEDNPRRLLAGALTSPS